MGKKREKLYAVALDGIQKGLKKQALNEHIFNQCSDASSKRIVKASLLAFADANVLDKKILQQMSDLAIQHRLLDVSVSLPVQETKDELKITAPSPMTEQIATESVIPPVDASGQGKSPVTKRRRGLSKAPETSDGI
jgi:hypothetical protein